MNNHFNIHEGLIDIDFEELITTVCCNEKEVTKKTIEKVFNEILQTQLLDARFILKQNMQEIINRINGNKEI